MPGNGNPNPQPSLPAQLGPFIWNPINFNGIGVTGNMQVTLFSDGAYNFSGSFHDPDGWDYDDALVFVIKDSRGTAFSFSHSGSMHGWLDRWYEGGSDTDSWDNSGTNTAIKDSWADLCAAWDWQTEAAINFDIGDLLKIVEDALKVAAAVIAIV